MDIVFTDTQGAEHTNLFLKSVSGHTVWHITDQNGPAFPGTKTFRHPRKDGEGINIWEARARSALNIPAMYCDNDLIFQRSFEPLLQLDFDVLITRQDRKVYDTEGVCLTDSMPYNGGLIICRNKDYFPHIVKQMEKLPQDLQHWYGNQLAMKSLENQYRTVILPCSIYNYTPDKHEDMQKDMSDKWMIHFKGKRKSWMGEMK